MLGSACYLYHAKDTPTLFINEELDSLLHFFLKKRHLNFQAEPPAIVVATLSSLCQMLEKNVLKLDAIQVLVVDEVYISTIPNFRYTCFYENWTWHVFA